MTSLPVIPASEYPERWRRVQGMMQWLGLDLLIAYADDRAVFGPAHARWLANFPVHFEPVCIFMPPQGDPIMLTGPESVEYIKLASQIKDVRVLRELTHPDEDYPYSTIQSLAEIITETVGKAQAIRKIGLAGRGLMSADLMDAFRQTLPQGDWVDVENAMCDLRSIKSANEIAVIRYAYALAEAGLGAAIERIAVGTTERAIAAEIDAAMRRRGSEGTGIDTIVASGINTRPILARSTFRAIQPNEHVLLTIAPRYEGYHAAIGRPVLVGQVAAEVQRAVEVAWEAQEACFALMKPGVEGREVEAAGRQVLQKAELEQYFLYSGVHSAGVMEFEPPIFGPSSTAVLQTNMVISVDIPIFNAPWGGLRIEDGFLITETGAERLHHTPYRIEKR